LLFNQVQNNSEIVIPKSEIKKDAFTV